MWIRMRISSLLLERREVWLDVARRTLLGNAREAFHDPARGPIDGHALRPWPAALRPHGGIDRQHTRGMAQADVAGDVADVLADERPVDARRHRQAHRRGGRESTVTVAHRE